jgi:hypothetical protein
VRPEDKLAAQPEGMARHDGVLVACPIEGVNHGQPQSLADKTLQRKAGAEQLIGDTQMANLSG